MSPRPTNVFRPASSAGLRLARRLGATLRRRALLSLRPARGHRGVRGRLHGLRYRGRRNSGREGRAGCDLDGPCGGHVCHHWRDLHHRRELLRGEITATGDSTSATCGIGAACTISAGANEPIADVRYRERCASVSWPCGIHNEGSTYADGEDDGEHLLKHHFQYTCGFSRAITSSNGESKVFYNRHQRGGRVREGEMKRRVQQFIYHSLYYTIAPAL